jgi:alpha-glucosidase
MLAVMSAGPAREIKLPLSFLGGGGYGATLVRDDETKPDAVKVENGRASNSDTLAIRLGSGGGFVARFVK